MRRTLIVVLLLAVMTACGGGGGTTPIIVTPPPPAFSIAPSSTTLTVSQDGTHATVHVAVTRTSTTTLTISEIGLPQAVTMTATGGTSNDQVLDFQVTSTGLSAGTYSVPIFVSDGTSQAQTTLSVTVTISASVQATSTQHTDMFLSTSFQPADWDYTYFQTNTAARKQTLDNLGSRHINLQAMDGATANLNPAAVGSLDFSKMDAIVQPVLQVTDGSPLFQIYAPDWIWVSGNPSNALVDPTFNQFADYAAMLVRYYNIPGGFTRNGVTYASPAGKPIVWWGIFNEPNLSSLTPQQYVQLYNVTAAKMLAVDPTIKLVAVELSDFGNELQRYFPAFVAGVNQPVDAIATHYYGSCNQRDTDQQVMDSVQMFHDHVVTFHQLMNGNSSLAALPIWITENNVNADFNSNGKSACNPSQNFVADARGSSAFFAAWRPLAFSKLVQANANSIHHWDYNADQQFGEVDFATGNTYLSYWVDYWLSRYMTDPLGVDVLPVTSTEAATVETMAVRRPDASVVVMISNHAIAGASDNNGVGAPRTIVIDTSALGTFKSATLMTFNAQTSASTGPAATAITPAARITQSFNGYGVVFLHLIP
jgi:Glycosyl hydrolase catalytic core